MTSIIHDISYYNKVGFYRVENNRVVPCPFADSKQIGAKQYVLQHDLWYLSEDGTFYVVREGFQHDGASKGFLSHFGKYTNASILHDALYRSHLVGVMKADGLFLEGMKSSGVSRFTRWTYYSGVRVVGWATYYSKSEEVLKENKKYIQKYNKV